MLRVKANAQNLSLAAALHGREKSFNGINRVIMHPHLEKAELPYVTACLNSMCQSVDQLLDVRKAQIDPLPCQRVYHMGGIPNESQPGPHIPASALQ